ncbi:MAG TPA: hypothetical protein VFA92_15000, partial [Candidatus Binatia bacterium]|nr:hypothetical protein [Candidatus Binatia bacterium]
EEPGDRDEDDGPDPPWPEPDATDGQLLRLLAGRGSVDPSELCVRLELPIGETIARLTRLELRGDVRLTAAGYAGTLERQGLSEPQQLPHASARQ